MPNRPCDEILTDEYRSDDRVIYNKRGLGYFVADNAGSKIRKELKTAFTMRRPSE